MKKNIYKTFSLVVVLNSLFIACKKSDIRISQNTIIAKTTTNFAAASLNEGHFAFFSLEDNQPVSYIDSATNKWDIAFKGTLILTNGGTSGPGAGGVFIQAGTSFADYTEIIKDSIFHIDNATSYAIPTGSGKGWYIYNSANNIITPIPGHIIIIRTATGKYAKVEITSYYKDAPEEPDYNSIPRYYNFRFKYQPNGTKKF